MDGRKGLERCIDVDNKDITTLSIAVGDAHQLSVLILSVMVVLLNIILLLFVAAAAAEEEEMMATRLLFRAIFVL